MKANVLERRPIKGLGSASGLALVGDFYYIVADGETDLFRLDQNFNILGRLTLYDAVTPGTDPSAKRQKRDLEIVTKLEHDGKVELLCFGSGSKSPLRDVIYRVDVSDPANPKKTADCEVETLYNAFRAFPGVIGTEKLNLEGACFLGDKILIFQRGNNSGINPIIEISTAAFLKYLENPKSNAVPTFNVHPVQLPMLWGSPSGFSDAVVWNGKVIFSASVEVKNAEGGSHATFFGALKDFKVEWIAEVKEHGETCKVKVEGLHVVDARDDYFLINSVTDPDGGISEIIKVEIK